MTLEHIQESLREKFYVPVSFPMERVKIEEAVQAFFKFLDEPEDVKSHIDFTIAENHRRGDVGFKHRDAENHMYDDNKDFFHFHPAIFDLYPDFLKQHPVVLDFVTKAKPIFELAESTLRSIFQAFEPTHPGIYNQFFDVKEGEHVHILLRFLRYEWESSGKYLAKPHFDAGSFTLPIAESCPGLRIGSGPEDLRPVAHEDGQALFMLSSNYEKVMPGTDLKPGWHDVIQLDETLIGTPLARWAVVAFVEALGVEALPREETHKFYKP